MRKGPSIGKRVLFLGAVVLATVPSGCSKSGKQLANRAFIEAVNLKCRTTKAKVEIAGRLAKAASETDKGKQVSADAQARVDGARAKADELIATITKLSGPVDLGDELTKGFGVLRDIPGQVSDGKLTQAEAAKKIEETRSQIRAKGFVDCV
jgi:hypothetical protein